VPVEEPSTASKADITPVVRNDKIGCQLRRLTAAIASLNWWARHRAVRTEYAAIAGLRFEPLAAALAFVEELTGIGRHLLHRLMTAVRTRDR
jgi:hypothetical protein